MKVRDSCSSRVASSEVHKPSPDIATAATIATIAAMASPGPTTGMDACDAAAPAPAAAAPAAAAPASAAGVAMPAAAKIMADNNLAAGSVPGTGKDGRVTKGDVLGALAAGAKPAAAAPAVAVPATPAVAKPLPAVAAPTAANLGDRPEQRVPMSRLRARIAERLVQSQSTNAILTTFNEVNMAPVMEMRKKFQEKFEKEHGVKLRALTSPDDNLSAVFRYLTQDVRRGSA